MRNLFCLAVVALSAPACATSYHAKGFGGGYSETALRRDVYRIEFEGNGYTKMARASELALWRAAELALVNGYTHFVVVRTQNESREMLMAVGKNVDVISKPTAVITVQMFRAADAPADAYEAAFLRDSLAKKYK